MEPFSMRREADRAIEVAKRSDPAASFWRGDVRGVDDGPLSVNRVFNLVEDRDGPNDKLIGQFRALTLTAAPEGYTAVVAVVGSAVTSQVPSVRMSQVIKSKLLHAEGTMGSMPSGEGLDYAA